jgi:glycosyltransferase involved in cell wall biosynthesis
MRPSGHALTPASRLLYGRALPSDEPTERKHPANGRSLDSLTIAIPAYNEAATIAAVVREALVVGQRVCGALEVVVCDDGSHDDTAAIVAALAAADARVRLLRRHRNRGIEASIRALYAAARSTWVFLISADQQWPMTSLLEMAEAAGAGADLVVGVRVGKRAVYSPYRRALSWSYEQIVRALGAPGGDPGSIKLGRRALLHRPVVARGVFAEGERLIRGAREGARIAEVAVEFRARRSGVATGARRQVVVRAALDALAVGCSLLTGWPAAVAEDDDPMTSTT